MADTMVERWQDISTAPKDGTPIYVWMPGWDGRGPMVRTAWRGYWQNEFLNGSNPNPEGFKPQYWMPIVGPPALSHPQEDGK